MVISWSYVHSEFWLLWKVINLLFSFCNFLSFASLFFLLKRRNWWNFFSFTSASYPPVYSPSYPPSYPPGYQPGYPVTLPNLTNQFIKLSDGDLQCEWNSDIFETILIVDEVWVHFSFSFLIVWSTDFFCYSNIWCWEFSDSLAIYEALYNSYLVSQPILILCCWICWLKQMFNINAVNVLNICWQLYGGTAKHKVTYLLYLSATYI